MFVYFTFLLLGLISGIHNPCFDSNAEPKFDSRSVYIFCSGSKTKSGLVAEQFNTRNKKATHVGLGFVQDGKLLIYNVTDTKKRDGSALVVDDLDSFSAKAVYVGIWKCTVSKSDMARLKQNCASYLRRPIKFDYNFAIADDDNYYCSEFCVRMLRLCNPGKFNFTASEKPLSGLYKTALARDTLVYYPVDFFTADGNFLKIYEKSF